MSEMPPQPPQPPQAPQPPAMGSTGQIGTPRSIGNSILLAIVTIGIYTFVWTYKTHEEIKLHTGEGLGGVLGFVVYFLLSPVTWFVIPAEVKKTYERDGRPSPVKPIMGLWFLLPLIGAFIWFPKVQGALNDYWVSKGATPK